MIKDYFDTREETMPDKGLEPRRSNTTLGPKWRVVNVSKQI